MQKFTHLMIPSDYGGVGFYRMLTPKLCANYLYHDIGFIESTSYVGDPGLYRIIRSVKFQRPVSDAAKDFFFKFMKPQAAVYGVWTVMDVDDCLVYDDIPDYNIAKPSFGGSVTNNLQAVMESCDVVTVSTKILAGYYAAKFNLPISKFQIVPNYLPRWWIGDCFRLDESVTSFKRNLKNKLKVGFICGGNHYDLKNQNDGIDDFTHLIDWVKSSVDIYDFHFVGGVPQQLIPELHDKKITVDPMTDIFNYPRVLKERGYNLWICPLKDNVFNRCKSNIKLLEAWALGIPVFVQDNECYKNYTPNTFSDANSLENLISELRSSEKKLIDTIRVGKEVIDRGDHNSPNGWWLENNMAAHRYLLTLPQHTMKIDLADRYRREKANVKERYLK